MINSKKNPKTELASPFYTLSLSLNKCYVKGLGSFAYVRHASTCGKTSSPCVNPISSSCSTISTKNRLHIIVITTRKQIIDRTILLSDILHQSFPLVLQRCSWITRDFRSPSIPDKLNHDNHVRHT